LLPSEKILKSLQTAPSISSADKALHKNKQSMRCEQQKGVFLFRVFHFTNSVSFQHEKQIFLIICCDFILRHAAAHAARTARAFLFFLISLSLSLALASPLGIAAHFCQFLI
jgi:hypothetical protein